jgi:hypothetical protein
MDDTEFAKRLVAEYCLTAPVYKFTTRQIADALGWRVEKLADFWRDCDKKSRRKKASRSR